ncbi:hypothetical protein N866_07050 [Actinotalea ferrariae CF5-4]|uniref:Uncharacterized protein n=1 Tax=Actinotalea ferrariae CF5-4 TaxID=948458 RepID=A0A021VU30_9CELL|nr:hypothetical protein [Actinotalea ferrariae]EYR64661.1 hypothetical protein N866_07050 [Actinotalea ferrariae CF5-4]
MTVLEVPRGMVRAALSAVVPHAGKESDDTPHLGRVRFYPTAGDLLIWATDHVTTGLARLDGPEYLAPELTGWDMPAAAVKKVLAVFQGPSNPDARSMWNDELMRVEVRPERVTFTEVGQIVDGQSLTVARIVPAGDDRYPDVPRMLVDALEHATTRPGGTARANLTALARFTAAAKAFNGDASLAHLIPLLDGDHLLLRLGHRFTGLCPTWPADAEREGLARAQAAVRETSTWWTALLEPHQRPVPVVVPEAVMDDLRDQATEALRDGATKVTLHVVRDGGDR